MQQVAAVRSVKQAVRVLKSMEVQAPERDALQSLSREAVQRVIEQRMQAPPPALQSPPDSTEAGTTTGVRSELLDRLCEQKLVHTGQNFDPNLSDIFFQQLRIR